MATQRKRTSGSSSGSTSGTRSKSRTKRGTSRAKRSNTTSSTSGGFTGLTQARQIVNKLQKHSMRGIELVNEFVALLPAAQSRQSRGRRASTSSST